MILPIFILHPSGCAKQEGSEFFDERHEIVCTM